MVKVKRLIQIQNFWKLENEQIEIWQTIIVNELGHVLQCELIFVVSRTRDSKKLLTLQVVGFRFHDKVIFNALSSKNFSDALEAIVFRNRIVYIETFIKFIIIKPYGKTVFA